MMDFAIDELAHKLDKHKISYKIINHYNAKEIKLNNVNLSFVWWGDDDFTVNGMYYSNSKRHSVKECLEIAMKWSG